MEDHITTEFSSASVTISNLPDVILLEIFSKLYFADLCRCAQVCHRWYAVAQSSSLRKHIITKHLKHWQLPLLVKYHFHELLESFQLLTEQDFPIISIKKQFFFKLRAKSPKLKKLVLMSCSLANINSNDMPSTLQYLSVRRCELNPYQFFGSHPHLHLPNITCLDVGGVSNFLTSEDLYIFTKLKSLRCLYLEGCFRINNGGIESITDILPQLEVLDVEGTDISNEGIETIISHCTFIKELYIGHLFIDDEAFLNMSHTELLKLNTICIKNTRITSACLQKINICCKKDKNINILCNVTSANNTENIVGNILEKRDMHHFVGCCHYLTHSHHC